MAARKSNNFSPEWRRKLSLAKQGAKNPNYGGLSVEHRQAIATAQVGPSNSNWRGGRSAINYSHYWSIISKRVRAEEGECQTCGETEELVVHHKDCSRANNRRNNLVTLCRPCHLNEHRQLGKTGGDDPAAFAPFHAGAPPLFSLAN